MESLKVMESINGQMEAPIKVILSMESGMAMEFGRMTNKFTKEIIEWIRNKDLECTNG
jgi:hypothetical protein